VTLLRRAFFPKPARAFFFAAAALALACAKSPSVAISAPVDGQLLTAADDLDPAAPGVQIAVDATTSAPEGSPATAFAGADVAAATVAQGKVHFPRVTVVDGATALTVSVVDRGAGKSGAAMIRVIADSFGRGCRIVTPADLSTITSDAGDTGLVNIPVQVVCRGLKAGQTARLFLDSGPTPLLAQLDASGAATFHADLQPGQNQLLVEVDGSAPQLARVTLASSRCTAQLLPFSGTTFNVAGYGPLAVADRDPVQPGEQARVTVKTSCPDGSKVKLVVGVASYSGATQGGSAQFDLTLPEGAVFAQAFVGDPGQSGASRRASWTVDSIAPAAQITAPAPGAVVQDAGGNSQVTFTGTAGPLGSSGLALLIVDEGGSLGASEIVLPVDSSGNFQLGISLASGTHSARVLAERASGNRSSSATVTFRVFHQGPQIAFVSPVDAQVFNTASPDSSPAAGFQVDVKLNLAGPLASGAAVTLVARCQGLANATFSGITDPGGNLTFAGVTLLNPDGGQGGCTLTASATDSAGNSSVPSRISVSIDRSSPAPVLTAPPDKAVYQSTAPELDCTNAPTTVLRAVNVSLADLVLAPQLTLSVNGAPSTIVPTPISGGWTFASVPVASGANTLVVKAIDPAGNTGSASASFFARCQPAQTLLTLITNGNQLGYAQDKSHSIPGEQIGVTVSAPSADGTALKVCSTVGGDQTQPCSTSGHFTLALPQPPPSLQGGSATFDLTLADGKQQLSAEVTDPTVSASAGKTVIVRSMPPVVTPPITIAENDKDNSLNQAELAASPVHFQVQVSGVVAGQTLEIHSTTLPPATVLGSAVVSASGSASVPVAVSALLGSGGYQQFVFYALVHDDAGNPNSIPGQAYPQDPAVTLGTQASPFVIAPQPTVSLSRPTASTSKLLAADDTRCVGTTCPGTDPLSYALSASTSAPDGSACAFLLDGAQVGQSISFSGGVCAANELLANGPSRSLAVRITDTYGNAVTSAGLAEVIDSIPPSLSIVQPPATVTSAQLQLTVQTGTSLEAGQKISILADGVYVGGAPATGSSTVVTVQLSNGTHQLVAHAQDVAGNPGASAAVAVIEAFPGSSVQLTAPAPQAGTVSYGLATQKAGRCAPPLQAATNVADGTSVTLFVATTSDCTVAPNASAKMAPASGGTATFTDLLTFADGAAGFLCAQVTFNATTASSTAQQFACDLSTPVVAFTAPASMQRYVAPPLAGRAAIASQGTDPATLQADFALVATAKSGSVIALTLDSSTTAFATTTLGSDCNSCAVTFPGAQVPVAAGTLAHLFHASVTAPSGNSASALVAVQIDIAPPADAKPTFSVTHNLAGTIHVDIASVPGDDGTTGAAPSAYDVRWSTAGALTASNWSSGNALTAPELPAPQAPGTHQAFDITLPTDQASLWIGARAVDQVGNLGAISGASTDPATVSTQLTRSASISIPNTSTSIASRMKVADIDGDGFDDVIISYPNDAAGNGAIYLYFGSATGLGAVPMVFTGKIAGGLMGQGGQAFDVGDFDGDGKSDIVAGATDCTTAQVYLWTGKSIALGKASNATPAPSLISDNAGKTLLGGTVRAAGHVTGGTSGVDLLVSEYTAGCGLAQTFAAAILPGASIAAPDWTSGTATALATSGLTTITLPGGHQFATLDATALDLLEAGTSNESLFVAFLDTSTSLSNLYTLPGSRLGRAATVALTSGTQLLPPKVSTPTSIDFGIFLDGGRDATGDKKKDLVLADDVTHQVFLYDATTLLSAAPQPVQRLDTNAETKGDVGFCALLLPDLNGDGIAEFSGCANVAKAPDVYFAFGGTGPAYSYFAPAGWLFTVNAPTANSQRGQRVSGAQGPINGAFGQKVGAGHLSSKTAIDLVVVSEAGSGVDTLTLLR